MACVRTTLSYLLKNLIDQWESETVEFKSAEAHFKTEKIGEYFSALSNEANLRNQPRAWLIFGIQDKTRSIVGTHFRMEKKHLNSLKEQISQRTEPNITFREIHEIEEDGKRVILFEIPAAPKGIPIAWKGHYYARQGESLGPLSVDKLDEIRQQTLTEDWTAQIVPDASFDDLDEIAIKLAKEAFLRKHAGKLEQDEIEDWSLKTFLDRVRITRNGQITRTALLLLGKQESSWKLSPHPAQLTWKLEGEERAYEHFSLPFLLTSTQVYKRIRNIPVRILLEESLVPVEIPKYDQKMVLEALHNCIAHQDYSQNARIVVTESKEKLVFENKGSFFEGQPGNYIEGNQTPMRYRNPFLAQAMTELNMIDTMGYGIHDMYRRQAKRYLPMPDYDLSNPEVVKLTFYGEVIDPTYSRQLILRKDLSLKNILTLDLIQKGQPPSQEIVEELREMKLVRGRGAQIHLVVKEAKHDSLYNPKNNTSQKEFFNKLIVGYLSRQGKATRSEIEDVLLGTLDVALNSEEKKKKVDNILTRLRRAGVIHNEGSRTKSEWVLVEKV